MIILKIKSLLSSFRLSLALCLLICTFSFSIQAVPDRYRVIPSETLSNFHFFEDKPWVNPPKELYFNDFLKEKKVVILHLWATSCPSCIKELKQLEQIATDYMNQPITFIVLSLNDPRSGVLRNYFNRTRYTHLRPYHNASRSRPAIKGLPTTLFFNKKGKLVGRMEGAAKWNGDEMKRLLQRLMAEDSKDTSDLNPKGLIDTWIARVKNLFA